MAMPIGTANGRDAPVAAKPPGALGAATAGTTVHCANTVIAPTPEGEYGDTRAAPPDAAANHPVNVNPARVGDTGNITLPPVV